MRRILLGSGIMAAAFGCCAASSNNLFDMSLQELMAAKISSVTKREESIDEVPATVYIINASEIKRFGLRDLKDILKLIPGIEYSYPHSWLQGGQRGFSGNWSKTKLMVDGVEVNLLYSGESFIGHQFKSSNIERVEVIQGPGSTLYGADAYSGIINIVTKGQGAKASSDNTSQFNYRAEQGGDDYGGHSVSYFHQGTFESGYFNVFAGHMDIQDVDFSSFVTTTDFSEPEVNRVVRNQLLLSGAEPYVDDNIASQFDLDVHWRISDEQSLDIKYLYLFDEDGGGLESPEISFQNFKSVRKQHLARLIYGYNPEDSDFSFKTKFEYHNSDEYNDLNFREVVDGGLSDLYIFDIVDSYETQFELQADYNPDNSDLYAIFGLGVRDKTLPLPDFQLKNAPFTRLTEFESLLPFVEQKTKFFYAQVQNRYMDGKLNLIAGIRKDDHSIYQGPITKRAGITYQLQNDYQVSLNYGESFRAPTMFELETNPTLGPATLQSLEWAISRTGQISTWRLTAYDIEAEDLIVTLFDSSQSENFTTVNEGKVDVRGVEFSSKIDLDRWLLDIWFDWTGSSAQDNISKWQGALLASYRLNANHDLSAVIRYFGDANTVNLNRDFNEETTTVDGFNTVDLTWLGRPIAGMTNLDFSFTIRNALDKDAVYPNVRGNDPKGFLLQGRSYSLELSYRF